MEEQKSSSDVAPPYVPYVTLLGALDNLQEHGIPGTGKIDKSLFDNQSGAIQGQLLLAFRFLGFIDDKNRVQSVLHQVISNPGERKGLLRSIVQQKFQRLFALDLTTVSQGQLDEAMRGYGVSGSTLIRATRFFVKACVELDIPISKRVSDKSRTVVRTSKRRTSGSVRSDDETPATGTATHQGRSIWEEKLLDKFPPFDPSWPDELKTKWFEGFSRLMNSKPGENW